ncbi:MAG: outer membrane beta-barrel protein [Elusimicrobia bacterium]|nr:outer membrane beta-barrel protein [Elusimicrobiota bacterium]
MKKAMAIAALLAVGSAASASAFTFDQNKMTYGAMLFDSMPQGDMGDAVSSSLGLGVSGEYLLKDNIKVGLEMGYGFSYDAKGAVKAVDSNYNVKVFNIGPTAKYFITRDKITYYGLVGLGLYHWSSAKLGNLVASDSGTDFGINLGGGAAYELNKNWTGGLDLRYHSVGGDLDSNFVNVGLKLDYKF